MACSVGAAAPTGTLCDRDGLPSTRDICVSGDCHRSVCGDGLVDAPEEDCDDDNAVNDDGCDNDCRFSCVEHADCSDEAPCNGAETCSPSHTCAPGTPAPNGAPCGAGRHCIAGSCVPTVTTADGGPDGGGGSDGGPADDGGGCPTLPSPSMSLECFKRCTDDVECIIVSLDCCCSCAEGGVEESINGDYSLWWHGYLGCGSCTGRMCLGEYNCSGGSPSCIAGQCVGGGVG
jgi:hypothetical protein